MPRPLGKTKVAISVSLDTELVDSLTERARDTGRSRSDVIEDLVRQSFHSPEMPDDLKANIQTYVDDPDGDLAKDAAYFPQDCCDDPDRRRAWVYRSRHPEEFPDATCARCFGLGWDKELNPCDH